MSDNPFDSNEDVTAEVGPVERSPEGFTVSFKGSSGYDSDMLVVKSGAADRLKALLQEAWKADLPNAIALFAQKFGKVHLDLGIGQAPQSSGGNKPSYSKGGSKSSGGSAGSGDVHPTEKCPDCGSAVAFVKDGVSKRGPWKLWKCVNDRGHDAVFTNG